MFGKSREPTRKVAVAIIDNDMVCRVGKYPISDDGTQIRIQSGGEGHFMPKFDLHSALDLPRRKKFFLFGSLIYQKIYFVKKRGERCINFKTEEVPGPSPEELKQAVGATMLRDIGKVKQDTTLLQYVMLGALFLILMKVFGMI